MSRYVDIAPAGESVGRCVILPGRIYTPDAPMLFFAMQAALARGWEVRQVWWEAPQRDSDSEEISWVCDQLDAAVAGYSGRILVIGKSLGTLAAQRAAEHGYDAAWLTPLLGEREAAAPLVGYPASQFVVIGSEDPYFDQDVLDVLPGTSLVVPGDHILVVAGDAPATAASHEQFVRGLDAWLAALEDRVH